MAINFLEKHRYAAKPVRTKSTQDYIGEAMNLRSAILSKQERSAGISRSGHGTPMDSKLAGKILSTGGAPVSGKYRISQGPGKGHSTGPGGQAWDYAVPIGTPAVSRVAGKVVGVKNLGNKSYGLHVIVQGADGRQYIYAHLSKSAVKVGQTVKPGQVLALTGNSGKSTGAHLHFEVR